MKAKRKPPFMFVTMFRPQQAHARRLSGGSNLKQLTAVP